MNLCNASIRRTFFFRRLKNSFRITDLSHEFSIRTPVLIPVKSTKSIHSVFAALQLVPLIRSCQDVFGVLLV